MIDDFADVTVANTCVFWDVEDFPIPDGHDPESVYQIIKSVIANEGYRGKVDIWAYGEKNKIRDEFLLAGITFVPEDKCARVSRMMSDVLFWALDNPSEYPELLPNVMVISKNISEDKQFLWVLQILDWRGYKILLVDYDNVAVMQHGFVSSVWLWTSLLEGGKPHEAKSGAENTGSDD